MMDAWEFYKKSIRSIHGQFNTNKQGISSEMLIRGYKPTDEIWLARMGQLDDTIQSELRIVQNSTMAKRAYELSTKFNGV